MLALQKTRDAQGLELREVDRPSAPGAGEVTIEVAATGICGSDLSIESWGASYSKFMTKHLPVTLGHETAGRIVAIGAGVDALSVGDQVVVNPAIGCGRCAACSADDEVGCLDRQALGMAQHGAFARYFTAPARYAFRLPDNVPTELGALVEPLTVGAHTLAVAGMKAGDRVVIFGPGPIGQGVAVLARAMGASEVAIVGMADADRFEMLRTMGFELLYDLADEGALDALKARVGSGFDIAVDAAGAPTVINQAMDLMRSEGVLAVAAMAEKPSSVDVLKLVKNRQQIRGVSRIPPSIWPVVIDAMAADPAAFEPLVSRRMPLSQALEAFQLCRDGEAAKILLIPDA